MKTFKNKKTGELVKTHKGNRDYYEDVNFEITPKRFIEDSTDWEEIKEKDYEILSYQNPNLSSVIFRLSMDGEYYHDKTLLTKTHGCPIYSVKRLSDGEVFTVGDRVDIGLGARVIEGFRAVGGILCVDHNKGVFSSDPKDGAFKDAKKVKSTEGVSEERTAERFVQKYTYKDKTYVVLDKHSHKDKTTREWVKVFRYIQLESGLIFSREVSEFYKLFQKI